MLCDMVSIWRFVAVLVDVRVALRGWSFMHAGWRSSLALSAWFASRAPRWCGQLCRQNWDRRCWLSRLVGAQPRNTKQRRSPQRYARHPMRPQLRIDLCARSSRLLSCSWVRTCACKHACVCVCVCVCVCILCVRSWMRRLACE
jgi:hypothetical protein